MGIRLHIKTKQEIGDLSTAPHATTSRPAGTPGGEGGGRDTPLIQSLRHLVLQQAAES